MERVGIREGGMKRERDKCCDSGPDGACHRIWLFEEMVEGPYWGSETEHTTYALRLRRQNSVRQRG